MLDADLGKEFWAAFRNNPLFKKWPEAEAELTSRLAVIKCASGDLLFAPGMPPIYLYLVVKGTIRQTFQRQQDTQPWLQIDHTAGAFLGQYALFANRYDSRAIATTDAIVCGMTAAHLRMALERNPDLYEDLLHEKRASRLRRIPLLRSMTDNDVRWLAQVFQEQDLEGNASVPVATKPGIWIIDWGQVAVSGPAARYGAGWQSWRLTSGNFFVAGGPSRTAEDSVGMMRFGQECMAETARAALKTHLYYLPAAHANRLIAATPDVGNMIHAPLDIVEALQASDLLKSLSPQQLQHLAQFCTWEFVPARQNLTTQGHVGHSYVILRDGAAVVTALDDQGRERPRNYVEPGSAYGATSLLEGKPRDATVRAVQGKGKDGKSGLAGAEVILLDRRDLQYAFVEHPDLWPSSEPLVRDSKRIRVEKQPFDWMQEGEVLRWRGRPHVFWLIAPELVIVFLFLVLVLLVTAVDDSARQTTLAIAVAVISGVLIIPLAIWVAYNYFDDYYAITTRRVTRRDHLLLLYEARVEAPVETIQTVTVDTNFWGRLFDFGDVTIRTAAKVGAIEFTHTPYPEYVQEVIQSGKAEALAAAKSQQKEELRRGLISGLRLALPIPERKRSLGDAVAPPPRGPLGLFAALFPPRSQKVEVIPTKPRFRPGWFTRLASFLPERLQKALAGPPPGPKKPLPGQVLWRKHWLNLVERIGLPFMLLLVLSILGIWILITGETPFDYEAVALFPVWFLAWLVAFSWLAWNYIDYRNDVYVVTDDRIIDIEMKPLGLFAQRREGGLERVQNVISVQDGIWAKLFNYGDVVISTAAADEGYTFIMVSNPKLVQATVFQKLDAFRTRQEQQRTRERQREIIEGLEVYHQLRAGSQGFDSRSSWGDE